MIKKYPSSTMRFGTFYLRHVTPKSNNDDEQYLRATIANTRLKTEYLIPDKLKSWYHTSQSEVEGMQMYHLERKDSSPSEHVYYIHGGAYVNNLVSAHWKILDRVLKKSNVSLTVPVYPLAPEAQVDEVQTKVFAGYEQLANKVGAEHTTVMGDSAGGGLAIALAQWLKANDKPQPKQLVLFSPFLDGSLTNPAIEAIEPKDAMLSTLALRGMTKLYAGNRALTDARVSPIYGDLAELAPMTIFAGTYDILEPDAEKLASQIHANGGRAKLHIYPEAFHVFVGFGSPETKDAFTQFDM